MNKLVIQFTDDLKTCSWFWHLRDSATITDNITYECPDEAYDAWLTTMETIYRYEDDVNAFEEGGNVVRFPKD